MIWRKEASLHRFCAYTSFYEIKRQKQKPKWRKNRICFIKIYSDWYFWSNEWSSSGIKITKNYDEDHSFDRKYWSKYVLIKHILFFLHFGFRFCLYSTYCLNILKISFPPYFIQVNNTKTLEPLEMECPWHIVLQ